jgi:SAM-dependent methyltransferase
MLDRGTHSAQEPDPPRVDKCAADCCLTHSSIARHFDHRIAELTTDTDFPEMVDVSAMLLALLEGDAALTAPTVLELGCGSGALTVALLKRGAARARGVDLSPGMLSVAVKRAEQAGVGDRAAFSVADGAVAAVDPADWVVMDRVICCYPDVDALLAQATRAARHRIAFTCPTTRGWRGIINRLMWPLENVSMLVSRSGCRVFVHSLDRIERRLRDAGFTQVAQDRLGLWHAAIWDRAAS